MKRTFSIAAATVLLSALVPLSGTAQVLQAAGPGDGMPGQANVDKVASPNDYAGLWGDAPGGVAGRPYVKTLNIINGGVSTPVITNGTVTTAESSNPGSVTAVIAPYNLCKTGDTPAAGKCYSSPNRLTIQIGYVKERGSIGYNFSSPTGSNGAPLPLVTTVNADTIFELVVNMNTWGSNLRWTWMNASPQFWRIDNIGTPAAEITMRIKLVTGPDVHCQSAIPVMPCDPVAAARNSGGSFNPVKILRFDSVLSLDTTGVTEALNGSLFASSNADIGSLETLTTQNGPSLNYGITGPSELGGVPNTATFNAFVSDASLLNYFGVTADVVGTEEFKNSALAIARADGGSGGAPTWVRWDAATSGTSGWFLTVNDISFNGSAVSAQGVGASALSTSQPARLTVKQKVAAQVAAKRKGLLATLNFRARAGACAKAACRVVVQSITGTFSASSTKAKSVAVTRRSKAVSLTLTTKALANQSLAVLLQTKKSGKWVYVSSGVVSP